MRRTVSSGRSPGEIVRREAFGRRFVANPDNPVEMSRPGALWAKPVKRGQYRLKLSADKNSKLLSFKVT